MAKTLKEEILRLDIVVNGDPARKEMLQLTRATNDLRAANDRLRAEKTKLKAEDGDHKARIKELNAAIKQNNETIKANEAQVKKLREGLKLTSMTTSELNHRHAELRNTLRNVQPGTPQWRKLRTELQAVTSRLVQLRNETTATEGVMCRMASNVNKYIGTVTATFAAFAMYGSGLYKAIETYSGLDEAMSEARKTTDMTREEVEELNRALGRIDTRSSQEELLGLARAGGKLGIAKNDIEGFTRAADIIKLALGKDLGDDVETTIGQIGKLVNVFQINKEFGIEQGMMKTAAAVNELGKSSTANEANIVEFMRRVGGVGYSAGISLANIAGLGATLDDLGQTMEVAGTSISQVITGMFRNTEAFASAANMSVTDFKKLMTEDMNEAIIRVAEGMGADGAAMAEVVAALDALNLNGTRATGVLTALAQNTDKLREQQNIANRAFEDGTSCLEEYNVMNNTTEATTEKLKKRIAEESAELGQSLIPAYHSTLTAKASLIKTSRILIEWLINNRGVILGLIATYAAYKTVILATHAAKKIYAATVAAARGVKLAYLLALRATTTATVAATGATKAATIATRLFSLALKATPLGWAAALIGAAAGALTYFAARAGKATDAQRTFNEINKAAAEIEDEHGVNLVGKAEKMTQLLRVVEDEATAEERRKTAIEELQSLMPGGIELINQETIANGKAAAAVKAYTDQLILQASIKAAVKKKEELIEKAGQNKLTGEDRKVGFWKRALLSMGAAKSHGALDYNEMIAAAEEQNAKKYQDNLDRQLAELDAYIANAQKELADKQLVVPAPTVGENDTTTSSTATPPATKSKKTWSLDGDAAFLAAKQNLRQQFADGAITSEKEYQDRLLALEIAALQARLAAHAEAGADRTKLEIQLADKIIEQKNREVEMTEAAEQLRIQNITDAAERENAEYEQQKKRYEGNAAALEQLAIAHNRRLTQIGLQRAMSALKEQEDEYKQARQVMVERHQAELQTSTLTKVERARLKQAQINELKAFDEEYLRSTLALLQELNEEGSMSFTDIKGVLQTIDLDTSLLSEQEKNDLLRRIKETENAIDAACEKMEELGYSFSQRKGGGSLFGFSQDDWALFFDNLANGKFDWEEMGLIISAVGDAINQAMELYASYDKMMTAKENAELKKYKKNQDTKKKQLQARLDAGLMTEEQHTQAVEQMDAEYERKQEELQIKQAKRQKTQSIIQATINTAAGVVKTLAEWGIPWGLIPAGIMAAMGAAQIAMIAATPITGAEEGGFPIERAQDGKVFNARIDPDARGYIDRPTVLVGENGMEYVIPNEAMQNPTAAPIINTFEAVRRRGRLRDFDFSQSFPTRVYAPGYAAGGPTGAMPSMPTESSPTADNRELTQALEKLTAILQKPIKADVSMMGRGGFLEKLEEYERMKTKGKIG